MAYQTTKIWYSNTMEIDPSTRVTHPQIHVKECDMFKYALELYGTGSRVCLHNYANNYKPGLYRVAADGSHYFVGNTQEEQLLRASLLDGKTYLPRDMFPISTNRSGTLLTTGVLFDKGTRTGKLLPENQHYFADVITCAAIEDPITKNGKYAMAQQEQVTLERMILVLNAAKDADYFLTGLWGCGAFAHPIGEVVRLWKIALQRCTNHPKNVVFCFYLDRYTAKNGVNISVMDELIK
jgi:uncharacterized protein (TIGR02452 family)